MEDKWLKDLHDRMSDFETDVPDGLWAEIEQAERQRNRRVARPSWVVWLKRASAVAAAVAAVAIVAVRLFDVGTAPGTAVMAPGASAPVASATAPAPLRTTATGHPATEASAPSPLARQLAQAVSAGVASPLAEATAADTTAQQPTAASTEQSNTALAPDTARTERLHLRDSHEKDYRPAAGGSSHSSYLASASTHSDPRLSLAVYSGGFGTGGNPFEGNGDLADVMSDGVMWVDSPLLGVLLNGEPSQQPVAEMKHHHPLRMGLSAAYRITDRLAVATGVTYTQLSSDFSGGEGSRFVGGEQVLHYVGVPLSATYDFFTYKRLTLYGTAGVLGEKCVKGHTETRYVLNNTSNGTVKEGVSEHPLQFSANAAAGVELHITGAIGVYAEPGLSYYFDDGSALQTYYKDHPLNFNLNLGLRFTLGR